MSFDDREKSRTRGEPVELYLFKGADPTLESLLKSVAIGPGTGEYTYATSTGPINTTAGQSVSDFELSVNDLLATASGVKHVTLIVAWYGSDLRAGQCEIKPKARHETTNYGAFAWQVGPVDRTNAERVSSLGAIYQNSSGGTPADRAVYEAISLLKSRGLSVTVYPTVIMDITAESGLGDPYGRPRQPSYPWRGDITCDPAIGQPGSPDKSASAASQIGDFFGSADASDFAWNSSGQRVTYTGSSNDWGYRRFILHLATIADAAGADSVLVGSELTGLTRVRGAGNSFPAVSQLEDLASEVRAIASGVSVSYAAHWSEYHSYRPGDGSGDVYFNMDELWSSPDVDYIAIDQFVPLTDWRDTPDHADLRNGFLHAHEKRYLTANVEGGEGYDWRYLSDSDRNDQSRSEITDPTGNKPWVYRPKDIRSFWENRHYDRPGGNESGDATAWQPRSKPIVFTAVGCPAVQYGSNRADIHVNHHSEAAELPPFSNGRRDDAIQRVYIETVLDYWRVERSSNPASDQYTGRMIDMDRASAWYWDARPYPVFPTVASIYWPDSDDWATGYALSGRLSAGRDFDGGPVGPYAYTDAAYPIVRDGVTYTPIPIERGQISTQGTLDQADLEVKMPQDASLGDLFRAYPPSQVVNLFIRSGHAEDDPGDPSSFPVVWSGRVLGWKDLANELAFSCEPIATSMRRPGLRRNYQLGCPHALYGSQCRADRNKATVTREVTAIDKNRIGLNSGWDSAFPKEKYIGGMVTWRHAGQNEVRSIVALADSNTLVAGGVLRGLEVGMSVQISLGCNHQVDDCRSLHGNILNYGGQPYIPLDNPIGFRNNYY